MHFLNESALADDCTSEIELKGRRISPVARHHTAEIDPLLFFRLMAVDRFDVASICKVFLNLGSYTINGPRIRQLQICDGTDIGVHPLSGGTFHNESIRKETCSSV